MHYAATHVSWEKEQQCPGRQTSTHLLLCWAHVCSLFQKRCWSVSLDRESGLKMQMLYWSFCHTQVWCRQRVIVRLVWEAPPCLTIICSTTHPNPTNSWPTLFQNWTVHSSCFDFRIDRSRSAAATYGFLSGVSWKCVATLIKPLVARGSVKESRR